MKRAGWKPVAATCLAKCFWGLESIKLGFTRTGLLKREAHSCKHKDPHPPTTTFPQQFADIPLICAVPEQGSPLMHTLTKTSRKCEEITKKRAQHSESKHHGYHYCPLLGDRERPNDSNNLGFSNWNHLFLNCVSTKYVRHSQSTAWDKTLYESHNVSYCGWEEGCSEWKHEPATCAISRSCGNSMIMTSNGLSVW